MYHLVVDALTNARPGRVERLDLKKACAKSTTTGFSALGTESGMYIAGGNILAYDKKTTSEPEVRPYAPEEA